MPMVLNSYRKLSAGDHALAHPPPGNVQLKQAEREAIARDVQAYLAAGGKIKTLGSKALVIPKLSAVQKAVIFTLGKLGRSDERGFSMSRKKAIVTLTQKELVYRANCMCRLSERGREIYNALLQEQNQ